MQRPLALALQIQHIIGVKQHTNNACRVSYLFHLERKWWVIIFALSLLREQGKGLTKSGVYHIVSISQI